MSVDIEDRPIKSDVDPTTLIIGNVFNINYCWNTNSIPIQQSRINVLKSKPSLNKVDAVAILTEWDEFNTYDWKSLFKVVIKPAFIFDGRNQYNSFNLETKGFEYFQIGK